MSDRKNSRSVTTEVIQNPILVGSVIILLGLIGVLLSYNANHGLPFVPTYDVAVQVPDAQELIRASDVRIRGARSGQVNLIEPVKGTNGQPPHAKLVLKLDRTVKPLPVDTIVRVRSQSILGSKYLEVVPGKSKKTLAPGATLPLSHGLTVVEIADGLKTFDKPTTEGIRRTVIQLGDALAGRGGAINELIPAIAGLIGPLQRVSFVLASQQADLPGFIDGFAAVTTTLATVSPQLGSMIDNAATTLAALSRDNSLGQAIEELPATEAVGTRTLNHLTPVLADAAVIARAIRPGTRIIGSTSGQLAVALHAATPVLRQIPQLTTRLQTTFNALDNLVTDRKFTGPLARLIPLTASLASALGTVAPAQKQCNVIGLWSRNLASVLSVGDANGSWLNFGVVGSMTQMLQTAKPAADLHVNPLPTESATECEVGNEPFVPGQAIGHPAGKQANTTEKTTMDPAVRALAEKAGLLKPIPGAPR